MLRQPIRMDGHVLGDTTAFSSTFFATCLLGGVAISILAFGLTHKPPETTAICTIVETDGDVATLDRYDDVDHVYLPSINEIWPVGWNIPCKWLNRKPNI